LIAQLPLIDRVVKKACFRNHLPEIFAEDFGAHVRLRLVENDYEILRKFEARSSLDTYLTTVVQRLLLDYRNALWGRWRPSVEATRRGEIAILLDRLLTRDHLTFDQAYEVLRTNYRSDLSRDDLYAMSLRLPSRGRPRVTDGDLAQVEASYGQPDANLNRAEAARLAAPVKKALTEAVRSLPPDDRRLLEMRFRDGQQLCEIARARGVEARHLYRQLDRIVTRLRRLLKNSCEFPPFATLDFDVSISW
jgi:RNA polymerase sigma factor for flagellar operon FliA